MKVLALITPILLLLYCEANFEVESEIINPPVNVQVTQKTDTTNGFSYYEISFSADNREANFAGYGIFSGTASATETAIENAKSKSSTASGTSSADLFCSNFADFNTPYLVQVGGTSIVSGVSCPINASDLSKISLSSGMAVAVRARVNRASNAWSEAASRDVP